MTLTGVQTCSGGGCRQLLDRLRKFFEALLLSILKPVQLRLKCFRKMLCVSVLKACRGAIFFGSLRTIRWVILGALQRQHDVHDLQRMRDSELESVHLA